VICPVSQAGTHGKTRTEATADGARTPDDAAGGEGRKAGAAHAEAARGPTRDGRGERGALGGEASETVGAAPHTVGAVEVAAHDDAQAGAGRTPRLLGELEGQALETHHVVLADDARRLFAEELIEIDTASQDLAKAAAAVEILRQGAPTDPRVLYAAYRIYTDLAGESMLGLSVAAPNSGQMHQAMAHELERQRDLPAAIANYRQALAADPHLPGAHFELAEVLQSSP